METLRLYSKLIRISMQSRLQYRADFVVGVIGVIVLNAVNLGLIGILVSQFVHLHGWTVWELVFLYCLWLLGHSLYSLLFWHINRMEDYLIQGTFDQFLIRPASPLVQFLGLEVNYFGIADVIFGIIGVSLAYANLGLHWGWVQWVFFLAAIVAGTLIEMTLALMLASIAFWTGRSRNAFFVAMEFNWLIQRYPVDLFGYAFRVIVTGLIPVAFMNYYPALMLLGKIDRDSNGWWLSYLSPVVALLLVVIAARVWRLGLARYSSAGG